MKLMLRIFCSILTGLLMAPISLTLTTPGALIWYAREEMLRQALLFIAIGVAGIPLGITAGTQPRWVYKHLINIPILICSATVGIWLGLPAVWPTTIKLILVGLYLCTAAVLARACRNLAKACDKPLDGQKPPKDVASPPAKLAPA